MPYALKAGSPEFVSAAVGKRLLRVLRYATSVRTISLILI